MVIGKIAIYFAEQFNHLAAQSAKNTGGTGASNAVARIDHNFQGTGQLNTRHNALNVGRQNIDNTQRAAVFELPRLIFNDVLQGLDFIAINSPATQDHFETVVIFGVVTARHLNTAVAHGVRRKIKLGCGGQPHIDDFNAHCHQAVHQGCRQSRPTQATIASNRHGMPPFLHGQTAKGSA